MNEGTGIVTSQSNSGWEKQELKKVKTGSGVTTTSINNALSFEYIETFQIDEEDGKHQNGENKMYSETSGSLMNGFGQNEILQTYSHLNADENQLINQFLMDQLNICSDNNRNMY